MDEGVDNGRKFRETVARSRAGRGYAATATAVITTTARDEASSSEEDTEQPARKAGRKGKRNSDDDDAESDGDFGGNDNAAFGHDSSRNQKRCSHSSKLAVSCKARRNSEEEEKATRPIVIQIHPMITAMMPMPIAFSSCVTHTFTRYAYCRKRGSGGNHGDIVFSGEESSRDMNQINDGSTGMLYAIPFGSVNIMKMVFSLLLTHF